LDVQAVKRKMILKYVGMKIHQGMVHIAQGMVVQGMELQVEIQIWRRGDPAIVFVQYAYQGFSSTVPHPLVELLGAFTGARPPRLLVPRLYEVRRVLSTEGMPIQLQTCILHLHSKHEDNTSDVP
jgi:hypothetical protein